MQTGGVGIILFVWLLGLAWAVVLVWGMIVWIRVGTRWLRLHPAPGALPATLALPPAAGFDVSALRAWAARGESAPDLARRIGVSGQVAAQLIEGVSRALSGTADAAELAFVQAWAPRILGSAQA
jgi:hypothetical protein